MEDIMIKEKKRITILIDREVSNKLNSLNKGSYNNAIKSLLGMKEDNSLKYKLEELSEEVIKIQEIIERLVSINHLKC